MKTASRRKASNPIQPVLVPNVGLRVGVVYGPGEFPQHNSGIVITVTETRWGKSAFVLMDDGSVKECGGLNDGPGIGWHIVERAE